MEPHKKVKTILTNVGICTPPDDTPLYIKYRQLLLAALIIFIALAVTLSFLDNLIHPISNVSLVIYVIWLIMPTFSRLSLSIWCIFEDIECQVIFSFDSGKAIRQ